MKNGLKPILILVAVALAALACDLPSFGAAQPTPPPTALVATAEPSAAAGTGTGTVSGRLYYPSEVIPPMTLYFENTASGEITAVDIAYNQQTYSVDLPAGAYVAYAWLPEFLMGGAYTPCQPNSGCADHTLQPIVVAGGQTVSGVDIYDWYGPPGAVPYPPGVSAPTGAIEGRLGYPGEGIPAMTIYAQNLMTGETYSLDTAENQQSYRLENLPVGPYYVFAWVHFGGGGDIGGGYSQFVPCGLSAECTDHNLIQVNVTPNQTAGGVDILDWYAPPGSIPYPHGTNAARGTIEGRLSFPSEYIPAMTVYARNLMSGETFTLETAENQKTYRLEHLTMGAYHVFAWVRFEGGGAMGGSYSQFVPCGLTVECSDHSLIEVNVGPNQTVTGIDIMDWYAPESVPQP